MNRISLCLFMTIKFVYFVLCHLGSGRVWTWVYDPPMTFTILSGRWVDNTGCPAKSSTKVVTLTLTNISSDTDVSSDTSASMAMLARTVS
jgi:hypothetical protein